MEKINKENIELIYNLVKKEGKENYIEYVKGVNLIKYIINQSLNNLTFDEEIINYVQFIYNYNYEMMDAVINEKYEYAQILKEMIEIEHFMMQKYIEENLNEIPEVALYVVEETKQKIKEEFNF